MTTHTATPAATQIQALTFSRGGTKKLLEGIPVDKMTTIPAGCSKNAMWVAAHIASTDDWFLTQFAGAKSAVPESWQKLFGMNSAASADGAGYPTSAEVMKALDAGLAGMVKWLESLSADDLAKPMSPEWQAYAPTLGDVPMFAAWHEGYHAGQLSIVRKGLGLAPAFG